MDENLRRALLPFIFFVFFLEFHRVTMLWGRNFFDNQSQAAGKGEWGGTSSSAMPCSPHTQWPRGSPFSSFNEQLSLSTQY